MMYPRVTVITLPLPMNDYNDVQMSEQIDLQLYIYVIIISKCLATWCDDTNTLQ